MSSEAAKRLRGMIQRTDEPGISTGSMRRESMLAMLDEALAAERQAGFDAGYKARRSSGWQPMRDGIDYDSSEQ